MSQNIERSIITTIRRDVEETIKKENDFGKKKRGRVIILKLKMNTKKEDWWNWVGRFGGEEEARIKCQDYEIETLIAIRGDMEEEFVKLSRK